MSLERLAARENCAFPLSASAGWSVQLLTPSDTVENCVEISDRSLYHDKESHHIRLENASNPDTGICVNGIKTRGETPWKS